MSLVTITRHFLIERSGGVAMMTAITLPTLLMAMLGGTTVMKALHDRRELESLAQSACNTAIKPQRLMVMSDKDRKVQAEVQFDRLAKERGFHISSRTVTADWLDGSVSASAKVEMIPGWGPQMAIPIQVSQACRGIPPYPVLGDVILSSNFKTPSGKPIDLQYDGYGDWGVFTAAQMGWSSYTGSGIELQSWKNGFNAQGRGTEYLPRGVSNPFVVELDSGPLPGTVDNPRAKCGIRNHAHNSSMSKDFELHPGTYRFSLFYRARLAGNPDDTNKLVLYLEGTRPVVPKQAKLVMNDGDTTWRFRSFDIVLDSYGLYTLTLAAEGCSDGYGGLFNDLQITYIRRPYPEYNDPVVAATN